MMGISVPAFWRRCTDAALDPEAPFERLFIDLEASPYHDLIVAKGGRMTVPDGPDLGCDPDMSVMPRYQVAEPGVHRT
jgi:L-alanine-DL-glutamate epimerase-like enolase superfamily enzyme